MPEPDDHIQSLPEGVWIDSVGTQWVLSPALIDLLVVARHDYDWPAGTGGAISQARIIALENEVCRRLNPLTSVSSHEVVVAVSDWAGNNANAHAHIVGATPAQQNQMQLAIRSLLQPEQINDGINQLCDLPGISLVIASKIYRFCSPYIGASIDRHASYFFNSLSLNDHVGTTRFTREWTNGRHTVSRLAIYNQRNLEGNTAEYLQTYLPILNCIAQSLNTNDIHYVCMATNTNLNWKPADVEMAAYYWWTVNGAR